MLQASWVTLLIQSGSLDGVCQFSKSALLDLSDIGSMGPSTSRYHLRAYSPITSPKRSESCVVVTDQEGEGDPCSIDTGHELATMVRAEMLSTQNAQIISRGLMRRIYLVQTLVGVCILVPRTPRMWQI